MAQKPNFIGQFANSKDFTFQKVIKKIMMAQKPDFIGQFTNSKDFTLQKVVKQEESVNGRQSKFPLSNCIWDTRYKSLYTTCPPQVGKWSPTSLPYSWSILIGKRKYE